MSRRTRTLARVYATLALLSTTLFFAALVWANDPPWKGKPYVQWNDRDAEQVFTDSPWTRTGSVSRSWSEYSSKDDQPNEILYGRDRGVPSTTDRSTQSASSTDVTFFVDWASSRPMRAASLLQAILRGTAKDIDVEKYVDAPQEEYQVIVQSRDMAPFLHHDESFFQANAFLELKKSKQRISPSHVQYQRDAKSRVTSAIFFFPKKTPSGDPTIAPTERNVSFFCKIEESALQVTFELQKMVDSKGLSL